MSSSLIAVLVAIAFLALTFWFVVYRLPRQQSGWTGSEKATLMLGIVSALVAGTTLVLSIISTDTRDAIRNLSELAAQSQKQTATLGKQVGILNQQLHEQRKQSSSLAAEALAASSQAQSGQKSVGIAQAQLLSSEAAARAARNQTSAEAKYEMRRQALVAFAQADAAFDAALLQIRNRMPIDIEEPRVVNRLTLSDLARIRDITDPIVQARHDYEAALEATIAAWPAAVRQHLVEANNEGQLISDCYEQAALRALDETEASRVRTSLNTHCRNLGPIYVRFRSLSHAVYVEMANEVFNAAAEAGARPNFSTPDSVRTAH